MRIGSDLRLLVLSIETGQSRWKKPFFLLSDGVVRVVMEEGERGSLPEGQLLLAKSHSAIH